MRSRAATLVLLYFRASRWLLLGGAVASCSGAHEPTQTAPTPPHATIAPTTNVPALLGKSIDGLRSRLAPAQRVPLAALDLVLQNTPVVDKPDSLAAFRTGGLTVVASYDARSRQVRDLLVLGRHEDSLMARASLQTNAHNYLVLPVFFNNKPNRLLGLRVVDMQ